MEKRRGFIYDQIYESIRDDILNLKYKPGEKLSESTIAEAYDVSRTPVRSVFQRLQTERLVIIEPQRGTFVTKLDLSYIRSIIYMRFCVESDLAERLIKDKKQDVIDLYHKNVMKQEKLVESENFDADTFSVMDNEFHRICYCAYGKEPLWNIISEMSMHYSRFRRINLSTGDVFRKALLDHQMMLSMLESGNTEELKALLREHLYTDLLTDNGEVKPEYKEYFDA